MTQALKKQDQHHPGLADISKECFEAMQSPASLALTMPFHMEEKAAIKKILAEADKQGGIDHFIAIGPGDLRYLDVALAAGKGYTAIEPSFNDLPPEIAASLRVEAQVNVVAKKFEDVTEQDLPEGRRLFFFLFNVFPYIEDALAMQKKLARPGDIVVVSGWNTDNIEARHLQEAYYAHLGREFTKALHNDETNGYIDAVQKSANDFAETTSRVKGSTTDILTLKVK